MKRLLIIGVGGHARVIGSIAALSDWAVEGVLGDSPSEIGEQVGPYKVVGTIDDFDRWRKKGVASVVLAVGDNRRRYEHFVDLSSRGAQIVGLRHPTALVEGDARVTDSAVLCIGSIVCAEAVIGSNALVNSGAIVDHECLVGEHTHIAPGVRLGGRVRVEEGGFVGIGSNVLPKKCIGRWAVVGAGSVVVDDVPESTVAFGSPARSRRSLHSDQS